MFRRIGLTTFLLIPALLTSLSAFAQRPTGPRKRPVSPRAVVSSGTAAVKGILEAVNYPADIKLNDAFFTGVDEGWLAGEHGTILYTNSGGANWTPQVGGDPNNTEHPIRNLRFLDGKHGWATEDDPERLLRTTDGKNWEEIGPAPRGIQDYIFTTTQHGIMLTNGSPGYSRGAIFLSEDSGKSWKPLMECTMSTTVQGLAHNEGCWFVRLEMLSDSSGYALACDNNDSMAIFHTEDAGRTWNYRVLPLNGAGGREADLFFTDVNHGMLVFKEGQTYTTADGGLNWHLLVATTVAKSINGVPTIHFADPQLGWVIALNPTRIYYTTDGGEHWRSSGELKLPDEPVRLFAFPRRDRAYIIGPHGMVYRYRIVPQTYTAANALDAPAMPAFGMTELASKAAAIRKDIEQLQSKLPPVAAAAAGSSSGFTQQTDGAAVAVTTAQPSGSFAQDSGGFVQDTTSASAPMADCCSATLQTLQSDTSAFVQQAPILGSQYRPMNLVVAGLQLVTSLNAQSQGLWNLFRALKHAPNAQAAALALQQFSSSMTSAQQTVSTGFQDPGAWYATSASGGFVPQTGPNPSTPVTNPQ